MRIAAEDRGGAGAALLRGTHAGLAGGAICIAGIDQHNAETMLTAFQVALSDDQRRGDHFVAGEHGGGGRRLVGHRAGKVRITAGFEAGAHGGKREAARHLIVAEGGSGKGCGSWRRVSHVAFTLSRERKLVHRWPRSALSLTLAGLARRNLVCRRAQGIRGDPPLSKNAKGGSPVGYLPVRRRGSNDECTRKGRRRRVSQHAQRGCCARPEGGAAGCEPQHCHGEHIAILGPNGCGKSTLIKAMTCECYPIVRPGMEMKVYGRDRWDVQELRKHLGVVATELPGERTSVTRGWTPWSAVSFPAPPCGRIWK
jgi:hypothetical protein